MAHHALAFRENYMADEVVSGEHAVDIKTE